MENLAVIMPVYNEEEIIETVVTEWINALDELNIDYTLFACNDGSKDNSGKILENLALNSPHLTVVNQENSWHGPTILKGYREKAPEFTWILQIDADREMTPESFRQMWEKRFDYDFLAIIRANRVQNISRKVISLISRLCIRVFYGKSIWDVNSPYRLMKSEKFIGLFNQLPVETLSPNMIISGFAAKKKIKFYEMPIPCAPRQTGEALNKIKLLKTAIKSFWQVSLFSFIMK